MRGRKPYQVPKGTLINWNQKNRIIGAQLGKSVMTIIKLKKQLGQQPLPRGNPHDK